MPDPRQVVFLVHRCFLDETHIKNYAEPRRLRDHLKDLHGFQFPVGLKSTRRYNTNGFLYLRHADSSERTRILYACPCCLGHYDSLNGVASHFFDEHTDYLPPPHQQQQQSASQADADGSMASSARPVTSKKRHSEALLLDGVVFSLPESDHLIVNNFDVSIFFHQLQLSIDAKWKHSLEDHMHLALASTSVLLLTPTVYPHDISPLISLQNWKATVNFIEKKYDIKYHPMPIKAVTGLLSIVNDLLTEKISRNEAYNKMTSMSSGTHMARFATALGQLVRRLPSQPIREDFGEAELCSRFVDPFLFELFDNPDNDTYFRWTNESTDAKHMEESKERPDFCITKTCSFEWQMNLGFGEAKSAAQDHDNRVICWDLIKVAVFCKQTLDIQVMEGTLGVQVIGRTVKFYILVLPAKGLYAFLELAVIQLPDSLNSLPGFVTKAGDIIKVLDIFERICVPASDAAGTMSRRTPTLSLTQVGQIFSPSKNRKRPCPLKLRTN